MDVEPQNIVTHEDPAWRDRTNYIVSLDLTPHGLPRHWEQCWTHTNDQVLFEVCCIPYFAYGISLGDTLQIDLAARAHQVVAKSGHRTIRVAFTDDAAAHEEHHHLDDILRGSLGCLVEFRGTHYAAIDVVNEHQETGVIEALRPLVDQDKLMWEWADPRGPE